MKKRKYASVVAGLSFATAFALFACSNDDGGETPAPLSSSVDQTTPSSSSSPTQTLSSSSSAGCSINDNTSTSYCSTDGTVKQYGSVNYNGRSYKTVEIGTQTWMAENLNYAVEGSRCYGDDSGGDSQNKCATYGRLYTWAKAMGLPDNCNYNTCASQILSKHKGICPTGWHIPDFENEFFDDLISTRIYESGFNIQLSGRFFETVGGGSDFANIGEFAYWWTSDENNRYEAHCALSDGRNFLSHCNYIDRSYTDKLSFYSVRCVKD